MTHLYYTNVLGWIHWNALVWHLVMFVLNDLFVYQNLQNMYSMPPFHNKILAIFIITIFFSFFLQFFIQCLSKTSFKYILNQSSWKKHNTVVIPFLRKSVLRSFKKNKSYYNIWDIVTYFCNFMVNWFFTSVFLIYICSLDKL